MSETIKILHLEDNIYDAELIAMAIKDEGLNCQIINVRNKSEFVDIIESEKFDIALCDYNVPPFSGVEAMKMIKEKYPYLPVIFVTGTLGEEKAVNLLKEGATDYLVKEHTTRLPSAIIRAIKEAEERKELKTAQESLRKSEQKYRNIFENVSVGIYRTTPDGKILTANSALIKMLGYSSLEELSQRDLSKVGFNDNKPRTEFIQQMEKFGQVKGLQSSWERKDKTKICVLESSKAIKDENGEIIYYEGTVQDITELKKAQSIIEKSEKLLTESEKIANLGTWEINLVEGSSTWSENAYRLLGYEPFTVEATQELFLKHLHPEDRDNMIKKMTRLIKEPGSFTSEHRIIKTDGSIRYHYGKGIVEADKTGKPTRMYGILQDVTELKKAQNIIVKSEKLLKESQEIANIGNWELNFVEHTLTWSENYYRLLGYEPFTVEPSQELFLQHIHPEDRDNMQEHMKKLASEPGPFTSEQRMIRTDGTVRIHSGRGVVEFDKAGKPARIYGIVQDVTEMKEAEKALITAKERAEESNKLKSQFLAQMSHEIRTPLNAILSTSQLFKEDLRDKISTDLHDLLDGIDNSGLRIIRTMDSILNMASIKTGAVKYNPTKFNLNSLVESIIDEYRPLSVSKHLYLEYKCTLSDSRIVDDEYLIRQIFNSLLDNAIKFTNEGGVKVKVFEDQNQRPAIEVTDTGIGISRNHFARLFETFSQESAGYAREFEGNGLGLALSKEYAEIIKAEISFESEKGKGSTFVIKLNPIVYEGITVDTDHEMQSG